MTGYLLDTNVISEYSRSSGPDPRVKKWVDGQSEDVLHLSVLTLGEIRKGTTLLFSSEKRIQLERWLEIELTARFAKRLLPVSREIADLWGAMAGQAQLRGIAMPIVDGLIGATAKHHGLSVVTRNAKDFRMWGVQVMNPWEPV